MTRFNVISKNRLVAYFHNIDGISKAVCVHEKVWPEGDSFESFGGRACKECSTFEIE